ncbi:hypothetical protein J1N35_023428 [Gossypium stocksii]|uniref:Uncharacterized protein n=1 Tax=Gossypium stocksii TaxID=47602 RepID=A0A9D3VK06_9ROSI|nr:hypothetical protein J1N35_023428 [Gossypium stocksii]
MLSQKLLSGTKFQLSFLGSADSDLEHSVTFTNCLNGKLCCACPAVLKTVEGRLLMENRCSAVFNLFGLCFVDVKL